MFQPISLGSPEYSGIDPDAEYVFMAQALRLLSGEECKRDRTRARSALLQLAESQNGEIASDARSVLREGHTRNWFSESTPSHQELERLASNSLLFYRAQIWRKRMVPLTLSVLILLTFATGIFLKNDGPVQSFVLSPESIVLFVFAVFIVAVCLARK